MSSPSFELDDVDRMTAGTVGMPGRRVFYLQARRGPILVTLKLEKQQLAALAEVVNRLLADLPEAHVPESSAMELEEPVEPDWIVGVLGVSYDEDSDHFIILAEELVEEGADYAVARMRLTREQAAALALHATSLVVAGRPPCPLCGYPVDPQGHACPRSNGQHAPAL